jgi:hypothetical protein
MSLDVYLCVKAPVAVAAGSTIFVRENGRTKELSREEWDEMHPGRELDCPEAESTQVFSCNITHNLTTMAAAAGVYQACWRPDELKVEQAQHLIPLLEDGLQTLKADPERFKALNPANGWGDYEGLVAFVTEYLQACRDYPDARIEVSR